MKVELEPNSKTGYDRIDVSRSGSLREVKAKDLPVKVGVELDDANDPGVYVLPVDTITSAEGKTFDSYHLYVTDGHLNVNGHRVAFPTHTYENIIITKVEEQKS